MCSKLAFPSTVAFGSGDRTGRDLEKRSSSCHFDPKSSLALSEPCVGVSGTDPETLKAVFCFTVASWSLGCCSIHQNLKEGQRETQMPYTWILKVLITRKKYNYVR